MLGSSKPLIFPDLHLVVAQSDIYLIDTAIKSDMYIKTLNKPVKLVSEERLRQVAGNVGKVVYLQFQTAALESDSVTLRLEAKIMSAMLNHRKMNLSSMELKFKKNDDGWNMIEQPTSLSS